MNILLTNDDGIAAPGLWAAASALAHMGRVTVVAPAANCSGYGAALPPSRSFTYAAHRLPDGCPKSVTAFGLAGTPAACAQVGMSGVLGGGPFDLVVSGVNLGANLGRDVFYSGTVGAALTAHLAGLPAIAISLDAGSTGVAHWATAARALGDAVRLWQANPKQAPVVLNVNVPNLPIPQLAGTMFASPVDDSCLSKYRLAHDAHDERTLAVTRLEETDAEPAPGTDAWAVKLGYVAVTPLRAFPDLLCVAPWSTPTGTLALCAPPAFEIVE